VSLLKAIRAVPKLVAEAVPLTLTQHPEPVFRPVVRLHTQCGHGCQLSCPVPPVRAVHNARAGFLLNLSNNSGASTKDPANVSRPPGLVDIGTIDWSAGLVRADECVHSVQRVPHDVDVVDVEEQKGRVAAYVVVKLLVATFAALVSHGVGPRASVKH
jgi:hypothetical protein